MCSAINVSIRYSITLIVYQFTRLQTRLQITFWLAASSNYVQTLLSLHLLICTVRGEKSAKRLRKCIFHHSPRHVRLEVDRTSTERRKGCKINLLKKENRLIKLKRISHTREPVQVLFKGISCLPLIIWLRKIERHKSYLHLMKNAEVLIKSNFNKAPDTIVDDFLSSTINCQFSREENTRFDFITAFTIINIQRHTEQPTANAVDLLQHTT